MTDVSQEGNPTDEIGVPLRKRQGEVFKIFEKLTEEKILNLNELRREKADFTTESKG